ncbi:MAG TPA: hypothetical protein VII75_11965 [Thermoanaerobaculia bacterium]|nr:hypothetical protein [Thermoanaerobaculia bacterium]
MLNIRFIGICCHVDPRSAHDRFRKRVVLINAKNGHTHDNGHNGHSSINDNSRHVPYVAFEADDVLSTSTGDKGKKFPLDDTEYTRFELNNEQVIIHPLKTEPYYLLDSFTDLVPSMTRVAPQAPQNPREECYTPTLDNGSLIAGYFDINSGWLMAGEREKDKTKFGPPSQWPVQRNAISTNLLVNWGNDEKPVVILKSIHTGDERRINLRIGTLAMTIGNQPVRAIEFPHQSLNLSMQDHYGLYYHLLPEGSKQIDQPLPTLTAPDHFGCQVQNWP